jgi:hypothetical protein
MWQNVRENERAYAASQARTEIERGQWRDALGSLDRAQARLDLGSYARESTLARIRCYEGLELRTLSRSHHRLIEDFYTGEEQALPDPDGSSIFRVGDTDAADYEPPPSWLAIPSPRYSPYARRSKIVGRVVVGFELGKNGSPTRLRVLEMPHPLLASWALEALALSKPDEEGKSQALMPGGRYVATFRFHWHWAEEDEAEEEAEDRFVED